LTTKINLPILRKSLVLRNSILRKLDGGLQDGALLSLVSAPAGYGKTTTIGMWVEGAGHPVAWVSLDKSDNDPRRFLTYVLAALQTAREDLGQAALEAVENAREIDFEQLLGSLVNDLSALDQKIVLVLEDYHWIEDERIDRMIGWILEQAIPNLHLVITTREDPNLPLTRLRVRNQLAEIRAKHLSFSTDEAGEFFSNVMRIQLSEEELEILKDRTEGWAAGLQLAALSLRESTDPSKFVEAYRGTHRHVLNYLIEEVLKSQTEEIQTFLQRTSILDQLSPSLCEAVTGQQASREHLDYLEKNNLFLVSLDEEGTWYRYHALFGELLRNQLLQAEPQTVDDLHERAADWYQKHGFIQQAVEHAFRISSSSRVASLIEKHAIPMIYRGEVSAVLDWFDRLPDQLMRSSPMMCIGKAWALALMLRRTSSDEVEHALDCADKALDSADADEGLRNRVAGHSASIRAYLIRSPALAGRMAEKVIETSQEAQRLLPESERGIRSVNALNIGYGYAALADLPPAEKAFQQAFDDGVAGGNFYAAIYGPISLITIAMMKGQLKEALRLCETNIDRFNRLLAGKRFPPIGALSILKGSIHLEENDLVEAEQALSLGLSLERWTGEFRAHTKGYSAMARLRCVQKDCKAMFESLVSLAETRPEGIFHAHAFRHRLATRGWLANESYFDAAQLWVAQQALRFDSLPDITGLDPVSEVNFQAYLSVAHILTRLAARDPQDYPLQDVHNYLARLERFAEAHQLIGWLVEIWVVRGLMFQVEGKVSDAQQTILPALKAAAECGFFRTILDEGDLMRPLLRSLNARLRENGLSAFVERLLLTLPGEHTEAKYKQTDAWKLSDREIEVLGLLAAGRSYKEIGQQLFLSLNTVQFHVKNIYGKMMVNKRAQAIEKAREMELI
jgi:LuxR family maltose regulon positive regulatory protein